MPCSCIFSVTVLEHRLSLQPPMAPLGMETLRMGGHRPLLEQASPPASPRSMGSVAAFSSWFPPVSSALPLLPSPLGLPWVGSFGCQQPLAGPEGGEGGRGKQARGRRTRFPPSQPSLSLSLSHTHTYTHFSAARPSRARSPGRDGARRASRRASGRGRPPRRAPAP